MFCCNDNNIDNALEAVFIEAVMDSAFVTKGFKSVLRSFCVKSLRKFHQGVKI